MQLDRFDKFASLDDVTQSFSDESFCAAQEPHQGLQTLHLGTNAENSSSVGSTGVNLNAGADTPKGSAFSSRTSVLQSKLQKTKDARSASNEN